MSAEHDCNDCPLSTRREFVLHAGLTVAGLAAALGLGTHDARAAIRPGRAVFVRDGDITYDIPASDGVTIDKDNEVILVRADNAVYAFALSCPHQNTALRWLDGDHVFQCPKHKSRYRPDGTFISGRATRGMDRMAVRKQDAHVVVTPDRLFQQDKDPAGWGAAVVTL